jgi:phage/plasmid-associated DNA primase
MALSFGFTDPPSSTLSKREWRIETDQVRRFVDDACLVGQDYSQKSSFMYSTYKTWAYNNGTKKTLGLRSFIKRLDTLGYGQVRRSDGMYLTGLKSN